MKTWTKIPKNKRLKKGQIIYSQGEWKCKVVEDLGFPSIRYIPLEGYGPECDKGKEFSASRDLFSIKKDF